jgi:uncharacterized damage-inducible protein DinB
MADSIHLVSLYCKEQYELVKSSRKVLLEYCAAMVPKDLLNSNTSFGRGGSIRNLLVHIANVYESWIGQQALKKEIVFTTYQSKETASELIVLFEAVDIIMHEFLDLIDLPEMQQITYELNNVKQEASAYKIFSHVITHEFHHKGQILSLSRHLGYTPVDTDMIR